MNMMKVLIFKKSKFVLKKEFKFIFKNFSTFNSFFIEVFLQYFSSTSNCVNVLSESDYLLIRGVVNLYFNELYMHANA